MASRKKLVNEPWTSIQIFPYGKFTHGRFVAEICVTNRFYLSGSVLGQMNGTLAEKFINLCLNARPYSL